MVRGSCHTGDDLRIGEEKDDSEFFAEFPEGGEKAVYFFGGIVVDDADAEDAAFLFDAETLGQIERVEISIPGENAAIAQELRDFCGIVVADSKRDCCATLAEKRAIGDAVDLYVRQSFQSVKEPR